LRVSYHPSVTTQYLRIIRIVERQDDQWQQLAAALPADRFSRDPFRHRALAALHDRLGLDLDEFVTSFFGRDLSLAGSLPSGAADRPAWRPTRRPTAAAPVTRL
jgi:hypothetical protein